MNDKLDAEDTNERSAQNDVKEWCKKIGMETDVKAGIYMKLILN